MGAFTQLTASTWGASFVQSRQLYSSIVQSSMTYTAPIWHQPSPSIAKATRPANKLCTIQNKCLQIIAGVYKATLIENLKTETFVLPIDLYFNKHCAHYQQRT